MEDLPKNTKNIFEKLVSICKEKSKRDVLIEKNSGGQPNFTEQEESTFEECYLLLSDKEKKDFPFENFDSTDINHKQLLYNYINDIIVKIKVTEIYRSKDIKQMIIFLSGQGGVGKTYFLNKLMGKDQNNPFVYVTASTAIASQNLGYKDEETGEQSFGRTVHSVFSALIVPTSKSKVPQGEKKESYIKKLARERIKLVLSKPEFYPIDHIKSMQTLWIDEISMISEFHFDFWNYCLQEIMKNEKFFGGINLILTGDFFQIAPVGDNSPNSLTKNFCFESENFRKHVETFNLLFSHRQKKDMNTGNLLSNARVGTLTPNDIQLLNNAIVRGENDARIPETAVRVYFTKDEVGRYNKSKLDDLPGEEKIFEREIFYRKCKKEKGCETMVKHTDYDIKEVVLREDGGYDKYVDARFLRVKEQSRIVCTRNISPETGVVNGRSGKVLYLKRRDDKMNGDGRKIKDLEIKQKQYSNNFFKKQTTPQNDDIKDDDVLCSREWVLGVLFDGDEKETVLEAEPKKIYLNCGCLISCVNFPVKLAWAITTHSCQGMTLENMFFKVPSYFGACGYVGLSRVRRLKDLFLDSCFRPSFIKADQKVVKFYYPNEISEKVEPNSDLLKAIQTNNNRNNNNNMEIDFSSFASPFANSNLNITNQTFRKETNGFLQSSIKKFNFGSNKPKDDEKKRNERRKRRNRYKEN